MLLISSVHRVSNYIVITFEYLQQSSVIHYMRMYVMLAQYGTFEILLAMFRLVYSLVFSIHNERHFTCYYVL